MYPRLKPLCFFTLLIPSLSFGTPVLEIKNNHAVVIEDEKILLDIAFNPKRKLKNTYYTIEDRAFLLGRVLIVVRGTYSGGDHGPFGEKAEIFALSGGKQEISDSDVVSHIHGNRFVSPANDWGVITSEAEGNIYGYVHILSDGNYIVKKFENRLFWNTYGQEYFENGELYFPSLKPNTRDSQPVTLVIHANGEYSLIPAE